VITFWTESISLPLIHGYLEGRGRPIAERMEVREYRWDTPDLLITPGPQVFTALDHLTRAGRALVASLHDAFRASGAGFPALNHPDRWLYRLDLLGRMADLGINRFRACPAFRLHDDLRFPVFVRAASDHTGNLSPLLHSFGALRSALRALRLRGHRLRELLVVEFLDCREPDGLVRKYAAMKVGSSIVPVHLLISSHWMVKSGNRELTRAQVEEELAYVETNPHRQWLEQVLATAGVEYGRIDYGMCGGRLQVWETNSAPTLGRNPHHPPRSLPPAVDELWQRSRELAHGLLQDAFRTLDRGTDGVPVRVVLDPALLAAVRLEEKRLHRRAAAWSMLDRLYQRFAGTRLGAFTRKLLAMPGSGSPAAPNGG
jgi:hypothetical protein